MLSTPFDHFASEYDEVRFMMIVNPEVGEESHSLDLQDDHEAPHPALRVLAATSSELKLQDGRESCKTPAWQNLLQ
jgi:hypothetical protein